MAKNEQKNQEGFVDWKNHVYRENVNIEMDGSLYYQLMLFMDELRERETDTKWHVVMDGKKQPKLEPQVFVSREGVGLTNFLQEMIDVHLKNAKSGKAVPLSELQESAIKLVEQPPLTDVQGNKLSAK